MTKSNGARIPAESKIIVGVEYSPKTGWHALHLHDALYAVSVQPDRQRVVIGEGKGRHRLRHLRIPFSNILRFEAVEHSVGHNCLVDPVNANLLGDSKLIPQEEPFKYVAVRLLVKHSTKNDFFLIYDLGTTPLPILVPLLKHLPAEVAANPNVSLTSANDCYTLSQQALKWVDEVNDAIERVQRGEKMAGSYERLFESSDAHYERLHALLRDLKSYDSQDVIQCKAAAGTAVVIAQHLISEANKSSLVGTVSLCSTFRLAESIVDPNHPPYSTVEELYETCKQYQAKTGRPIEEALDTIAEHLSDLKEREKRITSSGDLVFIEDNAPKPLDLIDVIGKINEKRRVLTRVELRHKPQLLKVFQNEDIEIRELDNLPFLSALVEYKTADGKSNFNVVTKKGIHQALQEFLLARELGNFYSHFKDDVADVDRGFKRFLRSSFRATYLDKEADHFGMTLLFPPAYLADRVIFRGEVSPDELLNDFLEEMEPVTPSLRHAMSQHIHEHVDRHRKLEQAKEPSFLGIGVESIEAHKLEGLIDLINEVKPPVYWVQLDEDSIITTASDNSHVLFGIPTEKLIGRKPTELVVPEEIEEMIKRAVYRKEHLCKIYYFTETRNLTDGSTHQVIVYSFPILENGKYAGAMATLRPLVELEPRPVIERPAESAAEAVIDEAAMAQAVAAVGEIRYFSDFLTLNMSGD